MTLSEFRLDHVYAGTHKCECKIISRNTIIYTGRVEYIDVINGLNPDTPIKKHTTEENIINIFI